MSSIFLLIFIFAATGIVRPYINGSKRWHFALAATVSLLSVGLISTGIFAKRLTPQELAELRKASAKAEAENLAASQSEIAGKVPASLMETANYTRAEYPKFYRQLGAAVFAKLSELEPGALYAVAESSQCDAVENAGVSDRSRKDAVLWFVDCQNGNRFMVSPTQAEAALARHKSNRLAKTDLVESCTTSTVAMCKATAAQRNAEEAVVVSACDILLKKAVASPSSLETAWRWDYGISDKPDIVIVQRDFESQNGFGAMLRSRYHCEMNAATGRIAKFVVEGPTGVQTII